METQYLYARVCFLITSITVAEQALSNVYARIKNVNYDASTGLATITIWILESPESEIYYAHSISVTRPPATSIGETELVQAVLGIIPGSSIYTGQ